MCKEGRHRAPVLPDAIAAELQRLVALLVAAGARRVLLYGSWAEGRGAPDSDLDLLVELAEDLRSVPQRLAALYAALEPRVRCDLLAYTSGELALLAPASPLVARVLAEGIVLYERSEPAGM